MNDYSKYPNVGVAGETIYKHASRYYVNFNWLYSNFSKDYLHWDNVTHIRKAPYGYKNIKAYYNMTESNYSTARIDTKIKKIIKLEDREAVIITLDRYDKRLNKPVSLICGIDQELLFSDGFYTPSIILNTNKNDLGLIFNGQEYTSFRLLQVKSIESIGKQTLYSLEMTIDRPIAVNNFIVRPYKKFSQKDLLY